MWVGHHFQLWESLPHTRWTNTRWWDTGRVEKKAAMKSFLKHDTSGDEQKGCIESDRTSG